MHLLRIFDSTSRIVAEIECTSADHALEIFTPLENAHWGPCTCEIVENDPTFLLNKCIRQRKNEYKSSEEIWNTYFDEGEAGMERLRAERLVVKAKFPKPVQS